MYDYCQGGTFPPVESSLVWRIVLGDARPDRPSRRTKACPYPYSLPPLDPFCSRRYIWPGLVLVHLGWGHRDKCRGGRSGTMWDYWGKTGALGRWGPRSPYLHPFGRSQWVNPTCYWVVAD